MNFNILNSREQFFYFISILIASFYLNTANSGNYELSSDEYITVNIVNGFDATTEGLKRNPLTPISQPTFTSNNFWKKNTLSEVISATIHDNGNAVFYNILLHYWLDLTSMSVGNARLLSALFSMISIWLFYNIALQLLKYPNSSLCATALFALHPLFLQYAHTARSYSLAITGTLLLVLLVLKFLEMKPTTNYYRYLGQAMLIGITGGLLLLTHYLAIQLFFLFIAYILTFHFQKLKELRFLFAITLVLVLTGSIFSYWYFGVGKEGKEIMQLQNTALQTEMSSEFRPTLKGLFFGNLSQATTIFGNYLGMMGFRVKDIIFLLLFPILLLTVTYTTIRKKISTATFFLLIGGILTTLVFDTILAIKANHNISFWPRYAVFAVPFAAMLLGVAITSLGELKGFRKGFGYITTLGLLFTLAISAIPSFNGYISSFSLDPTLHKKILALNLSDYQEEPYQEAARTIEEAAPLNDTLVLKSWTSVQNLNLYLRNRPDLIQKVDSTQKEELKCSKKAILKVDSPYYKH